jgi:ParB family chromosome partitioning protein
MASKRNKGLGRGLNALFEEVEVSVPVQKQTDNVSDRVLKSENVTDQGVRYIDVNDIKPNSKQPRKHFNEEALNELAESIGTYGIMEPIIVRAAKSGYEIVMGERRWRATRKLGLSTIPVLVKEIDDDEMAILALIENMQREDLNPMEVSESLKALMVDQELTQNEVADIIGKSRAYVANLLRLLKLPEKIRDMIASGKLSGGHGKAIGMLDGEELQIRMAEKAIKENLSVHDIERLAGDTPEGKTRKKARIKRKDKEIKQIEDELTSIVGAKVMINSNGAKGKMELYYYTDDELNNLIDLIRSVG